MWSPNYWTSREILENSSLSAHKIDRSSFKPQVTCYFIREAILSLFSKVLPLLGEGNGNPLPYSCLENPMDRGAR